jgi:hypothetical protein
MSSLRAIREEQPVNLENAPVLSRRLGNLAEGLRVRQ